MLFNSAPFLIYFLPLAVIGYQLASRLGRRAVIGWLVLASIVFYGYWNPRFVFVLLSSMVVNYAVSRLIARATLDRQKKIWMIAGVAINLLALCYFKYLFPTIRFLLSLRAERHTLWDVALPLGISFFTFTQIAYLVDLSEGEATPQNFLEYALFVTFFPHLIAGPILHHREIMPQFSERRRYSLNPDDMLLGLSWFVLGLAKKALIADRLGSICEPFFRHVPLLSPGAAWVAVLSYSLQLYFDFSGYSDMAIGLARMFSIRFPFNFNSPYKAANIIDFWARWHMTLTRYLTLYLYNPLSMAVNRKRLASGKKISRKAQRTLPGFVTMIAWPTIATMFLAGVWHGAGLQFLIFGLLHGIYITANHAWRNLRERPAADRAPGAWEHGGSVLLTYGCVLIGQVFFRANSTHDAITLLASMTGLRQVSEMPYGGLSGLWFLLLFPVVWFLPNTQEILGQTETGARLAGVWRRFAYAPTWGWTLSMGLLFLAAVLFTSDYATFLYFQF